MTTCCPTEVVPTASPQVPAPSGKVVEADGRQYYVTGDAASPPVLFVSDIFGFHPLNLYTADAVAQHGFLVVLPDFFDGKPWELSKLPPPDQAEFDAFFGGLSYDKQRSGLLGDLAFAAKHSESHQPPVAIGFCWGAKMAILLGAEEGVSLAGVALIHPSRLTVEDAKAVRCGVCMMSSKDEEVEAVNEALQARGLLAANRKFAEVHHGWMAARAKHEDAVCRKNWEEGISMLVAYLKSVSEQKE
jgi:dienelactone hydrolase